MQKIYRYAIQFIILLLFLALGEGCSFLVGGIIPGSVFGMVFLFTALASGLIKESWVGETSGLLLKNMLLYFLPATVGIMVAWKHASSHIVAIVVSTVISTILVIAIVGIVQQRLGRKFGDEKTDQQ